MFLEMEMDVLLVIFRKSSDFQNADSPGYFILKYSRKSVTSSSTKRAMGRSRNGVKLWRTDFSKKLGGQMKFRRFILPSDLASPGGFFTMVEN